MIPRKIRFVLLWLFYIAAITVSLLEIGLMTSLMFDPQKIIECYVYKKTADSVVHSAICSSVVACGFIVISTMNQIRNSLLVILKERTKEQAQKHIRAFFFIGIMIWGLCQIGSIILFFIKFSISRRELYFQTAAMFVITSLFAGQIYLLHRTLNRLEHQNKGQ